jgi:hypothetical protein
VTFANRVDVRVARDWPEANAVIGSERALQRVQFVDGRAQCG